MVIYNFDGNLWRIKISGCETRSLCRVCTVISFDGN